MPEDYTEHTNALEVLKDKVYFHELPSYGNKIFYSLGFLALTSLMILACSGIVMAFMGPTWWLTNPLGIFFRSIHEWGAQAFIVILVLHILVVFTTSAFKPPRRMAWVFGATIFCLALIQTEFGYALRGDFGSQYRIISGADFWNGAYLGRLINPLSFAKDFAIHVAIIPIAIVTLFVCHYLLVHSFGIAKPYRKDVKYKMVPADHKKMYLRGGVLVVLIVLLAVVFPSPFVAPETITSVAKTDPRLVAQTLMQEFNRTSGTATYLDSIDPYTYDTRETYVQIPYEQYASAANVPDAWVTFSNETSDAQQNDIAVAQLYFTATTTPVVVPSNNTVVTMINALVPMAQSGLYESAVDRENPNINYTYSLNFLRDTGVLDAEAAVVHITTDEWGMVREEKAGLPPGAWWFAPIGILNSTVLTNDPNGDRDGASILGLIMLLFILFPYIPYLNQLPEKLHLAPFIWK
jgi:hypothetical protein